MMFVSICMYDGWLKVVLCVLWYCIVPGHLYGLLIIVRVNVNLAALCLLLSPGDTIADIAVISFVILVVEEGMYCMYCTIQLTVTYVVMCCDVCVEWWWVTLMLSIHRVCVTSVTKNSLDKELERVCKAKLCTVVWYCTMIHCIVMYLMYPRTSPYYSVLDMFVYKCYVWVTSCYVCSRWAG